MLIKDHRLAGLSFFIRASLQKSRHMSSKSHYLNTSGGMSSGPAAFLIFDKNFTFLNSSIENKSLLISRASKMVGTSSSGSSASGGLPRSFLKWENHVLTHSSRPVSKPHNISGLHGLLRCSVFLPQVTLLSFDQTLDIKISRCFRPSVFILFSIGVFILTLRRLCFPVGCYHSYI